MLVSNGFRYRMTMLKLYQVRCYLPPALLVVPSQILPHGYFMPLVDVLYLHTIPVHSLAQRLFSQYAS